MRARWILGALAVGTASVGSLVGGCMLFIGGTEGYSLVDSGAAEASTAVSCTLMSDGGFCLFSQCQSAGDCVGDAGGEVCCLGAWSTSAIGTMCRSACAFSFMQVCKADDECGGKSCVYQGCTVGPDEVDLHVCGLQTGCSALAPAGPDGGARDSGGAHDSGSAEAGPSDGGASDASTVDAQLDGAG